MGYGIQEEQQNNLMFVITIKGTTLNSWSFFFLKSKKLTESLAQRKTFFSTVDEFVYIFVDAVSDLFGVRYMYWCPLFFYIHVIWYFLQLN